LNRATDDSDRTIIVFADGASRGNPGPGGWGAIVAFPEGEVVELGGGHPHTTNNRMEMTAALMALRLVRDRPEPVAVHTDSSYLIQGITQWIHGWRRKGWKTQQGGEVLNRDLWEELAELNGKRVTWTHVRGHAGVPGNERADAIASAHAGNEPLELYRGSRAGYDVDLEATVSTGPSARPKSGGGARSSSAKAYSYLSLVGGKLMRHRTWAECESRVKGVRGARFKKATSAEDEREIVRGWGVSPEALPG
jgi:ribonuclease HI